MPEASKSIFSTAADTGAFTLFADALMQIQLNPALLVEHCTTTPSVHLDAVTDLEVETSSTVDGKASKSTSLAWAPLLEKQLPDNLPTTLEQHPSSSSSSSSSSPTSLAPPSTPTSPAYVPVKHMHHDCPDDEHQLLHTVAYHSTRCSMF